MSKAYIGKSYDGKEVVYLNCQDERSLQCCPALKFTVEVVRENVSDSMWIKIVDNTQTRDVAAKKIKEIMDSLARIRKALE